MIFSAKELHENAHYIFFLQKIEDREEIPWELYQQVRKDMNIMYGSLQKKGIKVDVIPDYLRHKVLVRYYD